MIRSKPCVPHDIICVEFGVAPLVIDALFQRLSLTISMYTLDIDRLALSSIQLYHTMRGRGRAGGTSWIALLLVGTTTTITDTCMVLEGS